MTTINDVWNAYEEGWGRWTGCDWPTEHGPLGWDLGGVSAVRAFRTARRWRALAAGAASRDDVTAGEEAALVDMAEHLRIGHAAVCRRVDEASVLQLRGESVRQLCADMLAREWDAARRWLGEVECDAAWAEEEAGEAVRAAEDGDWDQALRHAGQACAIEDGYDGRRHWEGLREAVRGAAR